MTLHYAAGAGIESNGQFSAGQFGFNLADVQSLEQLNALPDGVKGLVWLNNATGVTQSFINEVKQYIGNSKLFGFYLADEPDPTGKWGPKITAAQLKAESDWIHANAPGAKTFIVAMDMGWSGEPSYANAYTPANTNIDYFGIDPYPVRSGSNQADYSMIGKAVEAAVQAGIPVEKIVPVYQAFGGGGWATDTGGSYVMPTAQQAQTMIAEWAKYVPAPAFDYVYHWSSQNGDAALKNAPDLLQVFRAHNAATSAPGDGSPSIPDSTGPDSNGYDFQAITGQAISADEIANAMAAIKAGTLTLDQYVDELIGQAQHTTVPALVVSQFLGSTPSQAHLAELATFNATQFDAYAQKGVLDPKIGPYEALGLSFSNTIAFKNKYGSLSDSDFLGKAYQDVFGRAATAGQTKHFAEQTQYFENLYAGAGQTAKQADLHAKGAALGQMLGHAVVYEPTQHAYDDAAAAFLKSTVMGQAQFGEGLLI